jgi:hypothetical protein
MEVRWGLGEFIVSRAALIGVAASLALLAGSAAQASVIYDVNDGVAIYRAPDFITVGTFVDAADLDACTLTGCFGVTFGPDTAGHDRIVLAYQGGDENIFLFFPVGTFSQAGVHFGESSARLSVTVVSDPVPEPVPEPATWALMILGFGAAGAAVRRARAARPA